MARPRSTRIARGQRRQSSWFGFVAVETTYAAANNSSIIYTLNAAALALRPFTIVRTRGMFGLRSDQAAVSEDYSASIGMAVVSDQAVAIGATAVPTPETDRSSDLFFLFETLAGKLEVTTDVGRFEAGYWKEVDSKAMRRVDQGQDLVVVGEASAVSLGCVVHTSFRMLVKLN